MSLRHYLPALQSRFAAGVRALCPPVACVSCGATAEGAGLCPPCREDLPFLGAACPACALPLAADAAPGVLCGVCRRRPPPQACTVATFLYEEPAVGLIQGLKFQGRLLHARLLGELMAERLQVLMQSRAGDLPRLLVPVPLHRRRQRERGYNQALEMARPIAARLGIPLDYGSCRRVLATARQSDLDVKARRANVRRAFRARWRPGFEHLAVVDDVMTTGHTLAEVVRCLQRAGAGRVEVWVCARAPLREGDC